MTSTERRTADLDSLKGIVETALVAAYGRGFNAGFDLANAGFDLTADMDEEADAEKGPARP
ncbi:MAG: hypothetical protein ACRDN9_18770 [Streptosporangiaceae bacterium]